MIAATVARGRLLAARTCVDTVSVARITRGALNASTLVYATTSATVYTGAARVKRILSSDSTTGEAERQVARVVLILPYDATGAGDLIAGDVVTVTASLDSALVDQTLTVVGPEHGTTSTSRKYTVEEVRA